ncbi:hypothetical protein IEQ34_005064 [Dendrobium chrysotoxum]|uniref:Uncharacterized protein n=1 Tax=Dendrobium chrysotoxum TaxID=161865 RepID=A0AAV7H8M6_DENCH|nr:hypothetical protein IEQ34_005064 [Dendrobium chrysotoxum]
MFRSPFLSYGPNRVEAKGEQTGKALEALPRVLNPWREGFVRAIDGSHRVEDACAIDCLIYFVALCLRAVDPETDAIDGNTGEIRRELPAVVEPQSNNINATMEFFIQMMNAMTQMIKNTQTQTGDSECTPTYKNLKLFQDMKPPLFIGGGPIKVEDWLMRI